MNHNEVCKNRSFPKPEQFEKKGVHVQVERPGIKNKINVRPLPAEDAPAGIQKRSHIQKVKPAEGVEVKKKSVADKDEDEPYETNDKF